MKSAFVNNILQHNYCLPLHQTTLHPWTLVILTQLGTVFVVKLKLTSKTINLDLFYTRWFPNSQKGNLRFCVPSMIRKLTELADSLATAVFNNELACRCPSSSYLVLCMSCGVPPIHMFLVFVMFTSRPHFLYYSINFQAIYSRRSWSCVSTIWSSAKHNVWRIVLFSGIPIPSHFLFQVFRTCSIYARIIKSVGDK